MIEVPSDDPLQPWRPGAEIPADEAALWQEILYGAGGETPSALAHVRREAERIDAEAEPYRAVRLWSILVRHVLSAGEPESDADLSDIRELAEAIRHAGNRRTLVPLYQWLHDKWLRDEGESGPRALVALAALGHALRLAGDRKSALSLLQLCYDRCTEVFGEADHRTIRTAVWLAGVMDKQVQNRNVLEFIESIHATAIHVLGDSDLLTIECSALLSTVYMGAGDSLRAIKIQNEVIEHRRGKLGDNHPMTLFALGTLGRRLNEDGDILTGHEITKHSFQKIEAVLGKDHPMTLTLLSYLCSNYVTIGNPRAARHLRSDLFVRRTRVLGEDHPQSWVALSDLGFLCKQVGDVETALSCYMKVLNWRTQFMPGTRAQLSSMNNAAFALMDLKRYSEALNLFEQCLESRKRIRGPEDIDTITSIKNLGLCLSRAGLAEKGLPLLQAALEARIGKHGPKHHYVAMVLLDLATCYRELGQHDAAQDVLERAIAIRREKFGENHPRTLQSLTRLVETLLLVGRSDQASELQAEVLGRLLTLIPGGLVWFSVTRDAAVHTLSLLSLGHSISWVSVFRELGDRYVELIDLTDPEELGYLRGHYARFHAAWLSLAIGAPDGAGEVPRILSAISGRETAALVLADLEARGGEFAEGDPRRQYLEVLRELRRLRMMLRAQSEAAGDEGAGEGDGDGAGGGKRKARLDPEMAETIRRNRAASRADLAARHDAAMVRYKALRAELTATDETFARAYASPDTSAEDLAQLLRPGEGLALLFSRRDAEGQEHHHACCVTPDGRVATLLLPDLGAALSGVTALSRRIEVEQITRGGLRGGRELFPEAVPVEAFDQVGVETAAPFAMRSDAALADTPGEIDLAALMHKGLWAPLTAHLPDVRNWQIATHQELHLLPVHLGLDDTRSCTVHPGLVFFWLNRKAAAEPAPARPRLLIHVDAAAGSACPIPFVEVEAELLRSIWSADAVEIVRSQETIARLQASEPAIDTVVFMAHGDEHKGPPRQTVIYADTVAGLQIDANTLLSAAQRPRSAVASACVVGRVSEDEGGEPLGLVSAFFVSGGRFVLAPLQPIDDLTMPIFTGLFHLAWRESGDPAQAIVTARHQALSGDWPAGFADLVRAAYRPVMIRQIEDAFALRDDREQFRKKLEAIEKSWPLPWKWSAWIKRARDLKSGANLTDRDIRFYGPAKREELVTVALDALLPRDGQRASVPPALRAIVDWTVAFGG